MLVSRVYAINAFLSYLSLIIAILDLTRHISTRLDTCQIKRGIQLYAPYLELESLPVVFVLIAANCYILFTHICDMNCGI